jgi:molybdate transport system substrate-binding protein
MFASADIDWMDWAQARNLIKPETRIDLLGNKLVVVAPADAKLTSLALERNALLSAIGQSRLATGEVTSVPAGRQSGLGKARPLERHPAAIGTVGKRTRGFGAGRSWGGNSRHCLRDRRESGTSRKGGCHFPRRDASAHPFALTAIAKGDGPARFLSFLQNDSARAVFTSQGFAVLPRASDTK